MCIVTRITTILFVFVTISYSQWYTQEVNKPDFSFIHFKLRGDLAYFTQSDSPTTVFDIKNNSNEEFFPSLYPPIFIGTDTIILHNDTTIKEGPEDVFYGQISRIIISGSDTLIHKVQYEKFRVNQIRVYNHRVYIALGQRYASEGRLLSCDISSPTFRDWETIYSGICVESFFIDSRNRIWIGIRTQEDTLYEYKIGLQTSPGTSFAFHDTTLYPDLKPLQIFRFDQFYEASNGDIWYFPVASNPKMFFAYNDMEGWKSRKVPGDVKPELFNGSSILKDDIIWSISYLPYKQVWLRKVNLTVNSIDSITFPKILTGDEFIHNMRIDIDVDNKFLCAYTIQRADLNRASRVFISKYGADFIKTIPIKTPKFKINSKPVLMVTRNSLISQQDGILSIRMLNGKLVREFPVISGNIYRNFYDMSANYYLITLLTKDNTVFQTKKIWIEN